MTGWDWKHVVVRPLSNDSTAHWWRVGLYNLALIIGGALTGAAWTSGDLDLTLAAAGWTATAQCLCLYLQRRSERRRREQGAIWQAASLLLGRERSFPPEKDHVLAPWQRRTMAQQLARHPAGSVLIRHRMDRTSMVCAQELAEAFTAGRWNAGCVVDARNRTHGVHYASVDPLSSPAQSALVALHRVGLPEATVSEWHGPAEVELTIAMPPDKTPRPAS